MELSKIKGFYRIQVVNEDGTLAGDSGYVPNMITNYGIQYSIVGAVAGVANSVQAVSAALGTTVAAVASNAVTLGGEVMGSTKRTSMTTSFSQRADSTGVATQYFYATWASGNITGDPQLACVGLFGASTTNASLICGNTFSATGCASNQAVNMTYEIRFDF